MEKVDEEQFSLLSSLISKRDIFTILVQYLTVKEIVGLDNVFCSKEFRDDFLYSLQSITILLPQSECIHRCIRWCCRRHIFESRGMVPFYEWMWMGLGDLSSEDRSFLSRVKHLSLKGDIDYLHRYPPFSKLETLSLEACPFNNNVMEHFLQSDRLKCLDLTGRMKYQIEGLSTALFSMFFSRVKRIKVENPTSFFRWVNSTSQTIGLTDVVFLSDKYCDTPLLINNRAFFQQCPGIQYLSLQGVRIDSSFFNIVQDLQSLHTLRLDRCNLNFDEIHTVAAVRVKCKRLEILDPHCNHIGMSRVSILDFFNKELQHLSFTACALLCLGWEAYESIPQILPNLLSFEINEPILSEGGTKKIDRIFSGVRNIRISAKSGQVLERWPDRNI